MKQFSLLIMVTGLLILVGIGLRVPNPIFWESLEVTVTAYNSTPNQTDGTPFMAAWGNRLTPGIKSVAVSRDLLDLGLGNGKELYITGFDGPYVVLDKMNKRFKRRIDLYFGMDVKKAQKFGKRTATIYWR
ncbi:hypothetical protein GO013_05155 [Pseudodesulfovibrio sp. JC047]|uniref:3D domain-containing protein n=1 Tax=Pseudodesulfovibrio sp. JC047 TaxID=2683199 RepID=UPI0013D10ADF|nr:3D domain-containing protein [Pseudodesulfovibrio sp. JC047]NDV18806.1 hypothetical protein [Pseudodesulfovibrio sp. JC047]